MIQIQVSKDFRRWMDPFGVGSKMGILVAKRPRGASFWRHDPFAASSAQSPWISVVRFQGCHHDIPRGLRPNRGLQPVRHSAIDIYRCYSESVVKHGETTLLPTVMVTYQHLPARSTHVCHVCSWCCKAFVQGQSSGHRSSQGQRSRQLSPAVARTLRKGRRDWKNAECSI